MKKLRIILLILSMAGFIAACYIEYDLKGNGSFAVASPDVIGKLEKKTRELDKSRYVLSIRNKGKLIPVETDPTPEPTPTPVVCGENAYESGGACYCNEGYTGDPYSSCYVIVPEPTPEQNTGGSEESGEEGSGETSNETSSEEG